MRIESIAVEIPTRKVTKEDTIAWISEANAGAPPEQVRRYCREVRFLLDRCGADTHYIRDRAAGESSLSLVSAAARKAMHEAGVGPSDIGLLIYCGVARTFLEPAMAYFVARSLGLNCQCFDVVDACMSWVRALSIAQQFLSAGVHRTVLIVNGECNIYEHGYPQLLEGISLERLRYTFPAFTIGEAATATLVSQAGEDWIFRFRSEPHRLDLCGLPIAGHEEYATPEDNLALNGEGQFVSFGHELSCAALEGMIRFIEEHYPQREAIHWWFPHAASSEMCRQAEMRLNLHGKVVYDTFPRYGNLVSASIPTSIRTALDDGRLQRNQRLVLCPVSAGMALALAEFVY